VSLTYVYCLVRSAGRPSLRRIPAGMPAGRDVRVLEIPEPPAGDPSRKAGRAAGARHWLIVSSVPQRWYGKEALERGLQQLDWVAPRALAHEAVVEHFLAAPAVLPMQLFTMFTGDERAVEHVVRDRRRIAAILKRIEGQVEWGLRLTLDPEGGLSAGDRTGPLARDRKPAARALGASGAAYLARKRDQLDLAQTRLKKGRSEANRMYRAVSREANAARRRTATEQAAPGSRLLLDAAFLVPARRATAFRAAVGRHARTARGAGLTVSLTGPWPAYNFI
jgi:hypothetical protein